MRGIHSGGDRIEVPIAHQRTILPRRQPPLPHGSRDAARTAAYLFCRRYRAVSPLNPRAVGHTEEAASAPSRDRPEFGHPAGFGKIELDAQQVHRPPGRAPSPPSICHGAIAVIAQSSRMPCARSDCRRFPANWARTTGQREMIRGRPNRWAHGGINGEQCFATSSLSWFAVSSFWIATAKAPPLARGTLGPSPPPHGRAGPPRIRAPNRTVQKPGVFRWPSSRQDSKGCAPSTAAPSAMTAAPSRTVYLTPEGSRGSPGRCRREVSRCMRRTAGWPRSASLRHH
jgi:hypothetical protein